MCTQDEKNQILTTNIWLNLVSVELMRDLGPYGPRMLHLVYLACRIKAQEQVIETTQELVV